MNLIEKSKRRLALYAAKQKYKRPILSASFLLGRKRKRMLMRLFIFNPQKNPFEITGWELLEIGAKHEQLINRVLQML